MKKIIYLIMAVALMCGCDKENEAEKLGSIYGVITDKATDEPIRAAGVQLNPTGTKTVTGNEGQYEFTELKAGSYSLQVTKTGYSDLLDYKIIVTAGKINKGDVQIEKLPVALRITNSAGQDIEQLDLGANVGVVTANFNIFNDGVATLEWDIVKACEWITAVNKTEGTLQPGATQGITITIDRSKLDPKGGDNTTKLYINSNDGNKELTVKVVGETKIPATLNTLDVTNITSNAAMLNGQIISAGTPSYSERGFVYATLHIPTLETTVKKIIASITDGANYSASVTGLTLGQTYYVRAYAINSAGTAYSTNEVSFTTVMLLPEVSTQAATNIHIGNGIATVNGTIVSLGDPAYTERGFCYGIVHNPTVDVDTKKAVSGTGTGVYSSNLSDLTEGHVYYVRAYATNEKGTAYGQEVSMDFNMDINAVMPVVTTEAATEITETSVVVNGTIVSIGDPVYTERGFVYAAFQNPTVADGTKKTVSGSGIGAYSANLTGLTTETLYYVRAYASTSKGTAYGAQVSFKPQSAEYVIFPEAKLMVQKTDINNGIPNNWNNISDMCTNSILGGYTDWRLPTRIELAQLYYERTTIGGFKTSGPVTSEWSSTAEGSLRWFVNFSNGIQNYTLQGTPFHGRCVRDY
jgi:hypothetical protein